ncbi:MAG: inositol monophosphatase [Elusimicrobia bacterium]|nr:inositol monophosphatase [Elusimicrobiota bacterium]
MENRKKFLFKAVLEAGSLLRRYFGRLGTAQACFKKNEPINLVSIADTESQRLVVKKIKEFFPGEAILAEEGDLAERKERLRSGPLWVLDPLDGTVNFLHGFPAFAVSLAFCVDSEPRLGAVFNPVTGEFFWGEKGRGSYLGAGDFSTAGNFKRLAVSKTKKLADSLMGTGFGYDRRERADFYLKYYRAFLKVSHDVRRMGAAALDLAWLAAGRLDGFWEWQLNSWDVAAGLLLIREAGGTVTHLDGSPYSIFRSEQTLATNGKIYGECLKIIRKLN